MSSPFSHFLSGAQDKFFLLQMKAVWIFLYAAKDYVAIHTMHNLYIR